MIWAVDWTIKLPHGAGILVIISIPAVCILKSKIYTTVNLHIKTVIPVVISSPLTCFLSKSKREGS